MLYHVCQICPEPTRKAITSTLEITTTTFEEKYLGMPTPKGRMKGKHFQPISAYFTRRLTNWAERFMSHGVKDNLVKSVARTIPAYTMSIFKMGAGFCNQYEKLVRDFWWGDEKNKQKVHWMSWYRMTQTK